MDLGQVMPLCRPSPWPLSLLPDPHRVMDLGQPGTGLAMPSPMSQLFLIGYNCGARVQVSVRPIQAPIQAPV